MGTEAGLNHCGRVRSWTELSYEIDERRGTWTWVCVCGEILRVDRYRPASDTPSVLLGVPEPLERPESK